MRVMEDAKYKWYALLYKLQTNKHKIRLLSAVIGLMTALIGGATTVVRFVYTVEESSLSDDKKIEETTESENKD